MLWTTAITASPDGKTRGTILWSTQNHTGSICG
jgi:hypothetical protein